LNSSLLSCGRLSAEKILKDNVIKRLRARKCLSLLSPLSVGAGVNWNSQKKDY
jgi:hypothetical protein